MQRRCRGRGFPCDVNAKPYPQCQWGAGNTPCHSTGEKRRSYLRGVTLSVTEMLWVGIPVVAVTSELCPTSPKGTPRPPCEVTTVKSKVSGEELPQGNDCECN